jgi:hypothetical protein
MFSTEHLPLSAFRFPLQWVEPAGGGKQKSADVERKTVMLFYPYPTKGNHIKDEI